MQKTIYLSIYKQKRSAADKLKLDYALDNQAFSWDDPIYLINIGELDLRQRAVVMRLLQAVDGYFTRKSDVTIACDSLSAYVVLESAKKLGFSLTALGEEDLSNLLEGVAQHSGKALPSFYKELTDKWPQIEAARIEEENRIRKQKEDEAKRRRQEEDDRRRKQDEEDKRRKQDEANKPQPSAPDSYTPAFNTADTQQLLNAQILPAYIKLLVLQNASQKKALALIRIGESPAKGMSSADFHLKHSLTFVMSDLKNIVRVNNKLSMILESVFHQMRTPVPRVAFQKNKGWGDYLLDFFVALGDVLAQDGYQPGYGAGDDTTPNSKPYLPMVIPIPKPDKNASLDMIFLEQKDLLEVTLEVLNSQDIPESLEKNLSGHLKILTAVAKEVSDGLKSALKVKFFVKGPF